MHFTLEHTFSGITLAEYETLYFDEAFSEEMCAAVKVGRTLLRLDRQPGLLTRHVRCEPIRDLPGPVSALLGGRRFAYVEELEFDLGKGEGRWRVIPNVASEKVDAGGTLHFEAVPGGGGVKRIVRGEIAFSLFGVGRIVERFVVAEVEKSYEDASRFTRAYLERTKHQETRGKG